MFLDCKKIILAIGAHPDDVEIGCGGTLAKHKAQDDSIFILSLSKGDRGGNALRRANEGSCAAKKLGARLQMENFPDGEIPEGVATISAIQKMIAECNPTHIYTHSFHETHQDHRNVHLATLVAARAVANIYCYQSPSTTVEFRPNMFVDISEHIETKLDLIASHESQTGRRKNLEADLIRSTARYWGRFAGCILAEPMMVFRQVA